MAGQFQPETGSNIFFTAEEVGNLVVTSVDPLVPSTIFDAGTPFQVRMTVKFAGILASALMAAPLLLTFTVQAESQGAGFEGQVGTITIATSPGVFQYAGNVPCGALTAGVYQLTCVLTTKVGITPTEIVGFDEVLVQVV
jgi:hypothetical protein